MTAEGHNEGFHVLDDFVCEAVHDPTVPPASPADRGSSEGPAAVPSPEVVKMQTVKYVHWQEGDAWLGYLQDYPDYWTQGQTLGDLIDHLKDLYLDLSAGLVP